MMITEEEISLQSHQDHQTEDHLLTESHLQALKVRRTARKLSARRKQLFYL